MACTARLDYAGQGYAWGEGQRAQGGTQETAGLHPAVDPDVVRRGAGQGYAWGERQRAQGGTQETAGLHPAVDPDVVRRGAGQGYAWGEGQRARARAIGSKAV